MRIYLSSYRMGERAHELAQPGGRAAIVMNALDVFPERLLSWGRETADLARLGYASTELDLRDFWADHDGLVRRIQEVDLLWVVGGNAFVLARAAAAAGLEEALRRAPGLTYAGYSAGACLTSVDLAGIEVMDPADALPPGYPADLPVRTLALSGTRVVPHAGTADADAAEAVLAAAGLSYTPLADGQDLILER